MVSALQAQLAKASSANAHLLAERGRGKTRVQSYLFAAGDADKHDFNVLHALAVNGFARLVALNKDLSSFEDALFSHAARDTDRTMIDADAVKALDESLDAFLLALSPFLLDSASGKVLEWLVRRFRINEFNVPAILRLFLPYHESAHFAKMLSILSIENSAAWSFLVPYKSAAKALARPTLVSEMRKTVEVGRLVASILPAAITAGCTSDALVSFNATVFLDFLATVDASRPLNQETIAYLLPAFVAPLSSTQLVQNSVMGSLLLLAALSQKCRITEDALSGVIKNIAKAKRVVSPVQILTTLVAVAAPQDPLPKLPSKVAEILTSNTDAFGEVLQLEHSENLFAAFSASCIEKPDEHRRAALATIVVAPTAPTPLLRAITSAAIKTQAQNAYAEFDSLLGSIKQRHPDAFADAVKDLRSDLGDEAVDAVILASSVPGADRARTLMAIDDSEAEVRIAGVRELLSSIESGVTNNENEVHSALIARVADTSADVLDVLYASPTALLSIVPLATIISAVTQSIDRAERIGQELPRAVLRHHLSFVGQHGTAADVVPIFWRWLLFAGSRKKRAAIAWEILANIKKERLGLFQGCVTLAMDDDDGMRNLTIAKRIAENIIAAPKLKPQVDFILEMAVHADLYARLLAGLVLRALLQQLTGEHHLDLSLDVCDVIIGADNVKAIEWPTSQQEFTNFCSEDAISKAIASKPSKPHAAQRLLASVIILATSTPLPGGIKPDWFSPTVQLPHDQTSKFIDIQRRAYAIPSSALRATLAARLAGEALLFFIGVSLTTSIAHVRIAALKHAGAFVAASMQEGGGQLRWDLQLMLPGVIVALSDPDPRVRLAAAEAIPPAGGSDPKAVYGYDNVYGSKTELVQYLDWPDVAKFTAALHAQKDNLAQDAALLPVFLQQTLSVLSSNKKSEKHRQLVLCFFCSHVAASNDIRFQVSLLEALRNVRDVAKVGVLRPVILENLGVTAAESAEHVHLRRLLAAVFDISAAPIIEDHEEVRAEYFDLLERCGIDDLKTYLVLTRNLQDGLLVTLNPDVQFELVNVLLKIGAQSTISDVYTATKNTIVASLGVPSQAVQLLNSLRPGQPEAADQRASKRVKTSDAPPETNLQALGLLLEALIISQASTDVQQIIVTLLDILSALSAAPNANYVQQLVMKALEGFADASPKSVGSGMIRLDVIAKVIRSEDNPQTFHQALLLFAKMAKLAPESMLFNVMPVFTFMGNNVVLRDDANSFRVVHKTIDAIIPVMVESLKGSNTTGVDLQIAARPMLKTFTDAAAHMPPHRRTMFFNHLVQTLGPTEFLEPICLLLVDGASKKILRQSQANVRHTLALPLAVYSHFGGNQRLLALVDGLNEFQQLLRIAGSDSSAKALLYQPASSAEGSASPSATAKKQAYAVLLFLREAVATVKAPTDKNQSASLASVIELLVDLYTSSLRDDEQDPASAILGGMLIHVLNLSPVKAFISSLMTLLERDDASHADSKLLHTVLELLGERLPKVGEAARSQISDSVKTLVAKLDKVLGSGTVGDDAAKRGHILALRALTAVVASSVPDEAVTLATVVPSALRSGSVDGVKRDALFLIAQLVPKLGARLVTHFRAIVDFCGTVSGPGDREAVQAVLSALLSDLKAFWGPAELKAVLALCLQPPIDGYHVVRRQLAKRLPSSVLLPALLVSWSESFQKSKEKQPVEAVVAFFELVKLTLQAAHKEDVIKELKPLTKLHIFGLDLRNPAVDNPLDEFDETAEDAVIGSFIQLVIKLNETRFTPVFRQLYDWAFGEDVPATRARKVAFARAMAGLLDTFRGVMDPYVLLIMDGIIELLETLSTETSASPTSLALWSSTVALVRKSLVVDDSSYWRDDRVRKILPVLVAQLGTPCTLKSSESQKTLADTMVALARVATDSAVLKALNLAVLMETRSEDARVRLRALGVADALWRDDGAGMHEFVAETETFILECAEDDNDDVCKAARRLQKTVDKVSASD